jgi:response regulator RpfG family c-di-GMP phosphodiesterase
MNDTPPHLGRLRVLYLEDSPVDADLVRRALTTAGYALEMDVAAGRADFKALLAGDACDIILADYSLPDFDAHAALELAVSAKPATPFICVSGTIGEEATVELLKQGADDCVLKARLARLPFAVQRAIDDRQHRRQLLESNEELRHRAEQLRRAVEGAVLAMSRMVESRDPYTAGHERRVAELAAAIALEMGMEGERLDALRLAATIHDIGKIAVPAEILAKPGSLSEIEFSLIKAHPATGFETLADIEFGGPVAELVLQHHERLDGTGYPRGLQGDEILPEARILAVADVVEAMSSHRPYRAALGMEAALAEVREHAGVKYDADVVAACQRLVEERGFQFAS